MRVNKSLLFIGVPFTGGTLTEIIVLRLLGGIQGTFDVETLKLSLYTFDSDLKTK